MTFYGCTLILSHSGVTAWRVSKYGVFSGPYFPVFGLNTEIYRVNLRIQSKYRKIWSKKNSALGHVSRSEYFKWWCDIKLSLLDGDYMILFCRDEISTCSAGTDFTLWLHREIIFHPGKAGQVSSWYLFIKTHRFSLV